MADRVLDNLYGPHQSAVFEEQTDGPVVCETYNVKTSALKYIVFVRAYYKNPLASTEWVIFLRTNDKITSKQGNQIQKLISRFHLNYQNVVLRKFSAAPLLEYAVKNHFYCFKYNHITYNIDKIYTCVCSEMPSDSSTGSTANTGNKDPTTKSNKKSRLVFQSLNLESSPSPLHLLLQ